MSTPSLSMPEPLPPQTLAAGTLQAFGSDTEPFTPELTADTTDPTLGTGAVQAGFWTQQGAWCQFWWIIQFGTSGVDAGSGSYRISFPPPTPLIPFSRVALGTAQIRRDDPTTNRNCAVVAQNQNEFFIILESVIGHATPWAWSTNDRLVGEGRYLISF